MEKIDNQKIYNENWTEWSDMKVYGPASRWLRYLIQKSISPIELSSIQSILDVGCGEGTNTVFLSEQFPNASVKGIDFSETGIKEAKRFETQSLSFEVDIDSQNLNNSYDMISCFEVLEHVDNWQAVLDRFSNSSKKYILLSFPTGRMREFEKNVGHLRNFKKFEIETYLKSKGFKPVKVLYAGFPFYNPIYRELCQLTNSGSNSFTKGKYSWKQKLIANLIYYSFVCLSSKKLWGDQFCGLFQKE